MVSTSKSRRIVSFRNKKLIYFYTKGDRRTFYRATIRGSMIQNKTRISRERYLKDIARLKKLNNKSY